MSNGGITHTSNHHSWNGDDFPSQSCDVNLLTFGVLYSSQSTLTFIFDFELLQENCTFFKNDR